MARYEEVQAAQIREGEHRGAANRLRTEHKEVGSGPGAGSAEVGADGGPTPAGSGESFPASFDRMVAFFRRSKGVFQQAVELYGVLGSSATHGSHSQCLAPFWASLRTVAEPKPPAPPVMIAEALVRSIRAPNRMSYAAVGGPNQLLSASGSTRSVPFPTQAIYPSGRINTAVGALTAPNTGSSHLPTYSALISRTRCAHGVMSKPPASPRLSSTGRASCSRVNTRSGPLAVTRSRSGMRRPSRGCPSPRS